MARNLFDPDSDDVYEWTERVTDINGTDLTVTLTLDEVDDGSGFTSDGRSASNIPWLSFSVTENTLSDGTREEILEINAQKSGIQDGFTYRFTVTASDGVSYNPVQERTFDVFATTQSDITNALTIKSSQVNSTLNDFPVYVDLSGFSALFYDLIEAGDVRVEDSNGTEVPRELVYFDKQSQDGDLYFKASTIDSSSNTEFTIVADSNKAPLNPTDVNGRNAVWSNGYHRVYHFADDPGDTLATDSTGQANANIAGSGTVNVVRSGVSGSHWDFPAGAYLTIPIDTNTLDTNADPFTLEAVHATDTDPSTADDIYVAVNQNNNGDTIPLYYNNGGDLRSWNGNGLNYNSWTVGTTYISAVGQNSSERTRGYTDGTLQNSNSSYNFPDSVSEMWSAWGGTDTAEFRLYEWSIANVDRSEAWIKARNTNLRNPSTFYTIN